MVKKIGYQGEAGANSHIACNIYDNDSSPIALKTFLRANNVQLPNMPHVFLSIIFNAHTDASRSRQALSNAYLVAKIGFDTTEKPRPSESS